MYVLFSISAFELQSRIRSGRSWSHLDVEREGEERALEGEERWSRKGMEREERDFVCQAVIQRDGGENEL